MRTQNKKDFKALMEKINKLMLEYGKPFIIMIRSPRDKKVCIQATKINRITCMQTYCIFAEHLGRVLKIKNPKKVFSEILQSRDKEHIIKQDKFIGEKDGKD